VQKGAFPGTGLTDDGEHLAALDVEGESVKQREAAAAGDVFLAEVPDANDWMIGQGWRSQTYGRRVIAWCCTGGDRIHTYLYHPVP
jgi:hypothetical protein